MFIGGELCKAKMACIGVAQKGIGAKPCNAKENEDDLQEMMRGSFGILFLFLREIAILFWFVFITLS